MALKTIWIKEETKVEFKKLKSYPKESDNDVLERMMKEREKK